MFIFWFRVVYFVVFVFTCFLIEMKDMIYTIQALCIGNCTDCLYFESCVAKSFYFHDVQLLSISLQHIYLRAALLCLMFSTYLTLLEIKFVFNPFNLSQSTAAYKAASRLAIATPPPAYVLSRGIGWQVSYFDKIITLVISSASCFCSNLKRLSDSL